MHVVEGDEMDGEGQVEDEIVDAGGVCFHDFDVMGDFGPVEEATAG